MKQFSFNDDLKQSNEKKSQSQRYQISSRQSQNAAPSNHTTQCQRQQFQTVYKGHTSGTTEKQRINTEKIHQEIRLQTRIHSANQLQTIRVLLNQNRYDCISTLPQQNKKVVREGLDKENRPASMNELKHPSFSKSKLNFYNTQKFESIRLIQPILENNEKQSDQIKQKQLLERSTKLKITKSNSRTRLLKLNLKEHKDHRKTKPKTQFEDKYEATDRIRKEHKTIQHQNEYNPQRSFRKGILDQIFCKIRTKQDTSIEKNHKMEHFIQKLSPTVSKIQQPAQMASPQIKTKQNIFEVGFSTIRQKQQNNSSFMSKVALGQLLKPNNEECIPFNIDNLQMEKHKKIDIQKFRKKFPDNFFK